MKKCIECDSEIAKSSTRCRKCANRLRARSRRGPSNHRWQGGRSITKDGYVVIRVDGKPVREHRYIMENHIGRKLLPGENVHHINGDKQDNRIENLELWVVNQPRGQRIEDLLEFAYDIIARYG